MSEVPAEITATQKFFALYDNLSLERYTLPVKRCKERTSDVPRGGINGV